MGLRDRLHDKNTLFVDHYSGYETTIEADGTILSKRYYYDDIEHADVFRMLQTLRAEGEEYTYKVKILPVAIGNFNFDW